MVPKNEPIKYILYVWPNMFFEQPGLGHMKEIARTLIIESAISNRVAILPPLIPNKTHNSNCKKPLRWFDYFDWSHLNVVDFRLDSKKKFYSFIKNINNVKLLFEDNVSNISLFEEELIIRYFNNPNIWGDWIKNKENFDNRLLEPSFSDNYPKEIWDQASKIINEIGSLNGVIHIRRGDLSCKETEPEEIIKYLKNKGVSLNDKIFILTNESNLKYYKHLKRIFPNLVFEKDVKTLKIKDNYRIFRIGKCIQYRADFLKLGTLRYMKSISYDSLYKKIIARANYKLLKILNLQKLITFVSINKLLVEKS